MLWCGNQEAVKSVCHWKRTRISQVTALFFWKNGLLPTWSVTHQAKTSYGESDFFEDIVAINCTVMTANLLVWSPTLELIFIVIHYKKDCRTQKYIKVFAASVIVTARWFGKHSKNLRSRYIWYWNLSWKTVLIFKDGRKTSKKCGRTFYEGECFNGICALTTTTNTFVWHLHCHIPASRPSRVSVTTSTARVIQHV